MFTILGWLFYGLIVGLIAKALHPGDDPVGFLPTIGIGVAGSYVGGLVSWVIGFGSSAFAPAGMLMGIVGGVAFLAGFRWWKLRNSSDGPRSFFSGRKLK